MTPEEIEKAAMSNLTDSYEGQENYEGEDQYEGEDNYVGFDDDSVEFAGGASSFVDEGRAGLNFTMTFANLGANAVERVIAITPGYLSALADIKDAQGNAVAGIAKDGLIVGTVAGGDALTGVGKPKKIDELIAFLDKNACRFTGIKMLVNNSDQLEQELLIRKLSPFRNLGDETLTPSHYKDSMQQDDKRVEIPLQNFQLDDQTVLIYTIGAGRSVTFNFFAGAIRNVAGELAKKAKRARTNITKAKTPTKKIPVRRKFGK